MTQTIQSGRTVESVDLKSLKVKLFADGAKIEDMVDVYSKGIVTGFTTNPTLMRKAGVSEYEKFAKEVLQKVKAYSISFEVFSDEFDEMEKQARKIMAWGESVYVKIPIQNTKGQSSAPLIKKLAQEGVKLNITAILTWEQVETVAEALNPKVPSIVSIFAGRIADTGRDPMPLMKEAAKLLTAKNPKAELLWASTREIFNIVQAEECGCAIITVPPDILKKSSMVGGDLNELALDTVKMFYEDGKKAGFSL